MSTNSTKKNLELFFCTSAVFAFLFLCSPLVTTALAGLKVHYFFAAPLAASALSCLFRTFFVKRLNVGKSSLVLTLVSIPVALLLFVFFQNQLHAYLVSQILEQTSFLFHFLMQAIQPRHEFSLLFCVSLPFFFYGSYLSQCFEGFNSDRTWLVYFIETCGVLLGALVGTLLLDATSYSLVLISIALLSAMSLLLGLSRVSASVFLLVFVMLVLAPPDLLEPKRDLHWSARDYPQKNKVEELARDWNTYSKVQLLRIHQAENSYSETISISDGNGHARKRSVENGKVSIKTWLPERMIIPFQPKKVLVLFAGGGGDLIALRTQLPEAELVGVELNKHLVDMAMLPPSLLKQNLEQGNMRLINSEGRRFLETTKETFDAVLFSWSGASFSYAAGAAIHTTQYAMTEEAIRASLKVLRKDGVLALLGGSKVNLLLSLIKAKDPQEQLSQSLALVGFENVTAIKTIAPWDLHGLIYKKGNFTENEVLKLEDSLKEINVKLLASPHYESDPQIISIYHAKSYEEALSNIQKLSPNVYPQSYTDDLPYVYSLHRKFGLNAKQIFFHFVNVGLYLKSPGRETFGLFLALVIIFLIFLFRFKYQVTTSSLIQSASLGVFSTVLIIFLTLKSLLYIGSPTYSIAYSQVAAMLGVCLGAWLWQKRFRAYLLPLIGILAGVTWNPLSEALKPMMFQPFLGPLFTLIWVLPIFIVSSWLFTQVLSQSREAAPRFASFNLSVNLLSASAAAFIAPVFMENIGFSKTWNLSLIFLVVPLIFWLNSLRHRAMN